MDFVESAIEHQWKWKVELSLPVLISTPALSLIISKKQARYKKKYCRPLDEVEFLNLDQVTFLAVFRQTLNVTQLQQLRQFVKFKFAEKYTPSVTYTGPMYDALMTNQGKSTMISWLSISHG